MSGRQKPENWLSRVSCALAEPLDFYARRLSVERNSYGDVAGWLAGWLAVTLRYCIKTAKPIRKVFRPYESPIILVF